MRSSQGEPDLMKARLNAAEEAENFIRDQAIEFAETMTKLRVTPERVGTFDLKRRSLLSDVYTWQETCRGWLVGGGENPADLMTSLTGAKSEHRLDHLVGVKELREEADKHVIFVSSIGAALVPKSVNWRRVRDLGKEYRGLPRGVEYCLVTDLTPFRIAFRQSSFEGVAAALAEFKLSAGHAFVQENLRRMGLGGIA